MGPPPATHGVTHGSSFPQDTLTLAFKCGNTLGADKSTLMKASRVLRDALSLESSAPGVLDVGDDSEAAWRAVLVMLDLSAHPLDLITWVSEGCVDKL
ncbi:hypothetical protein GPECTOR_4g696 [Gonium pectorale]|uniref:Uncharacterized protein n=1 Tax=Gonium pectorale TaxID=33097 RepID=A0A150GXS6_GONPE|nr:hypothetical protein GPECTOR_4g696 [Gonium pectorale]|eukprot:KXZ54631.1 hypothetical protein GPECTOR_4g696 [Gonium pectorale]